MNKTINVNGNRLVTIVAPEDQNKAITKNDAEMDMRAREAVKSAINKAVTCKKPVAKYDKASGKAYIEKADGEKIYVG